MWTFESRTSATSGMCPIIEVHVAPGDVVAAEDPIITLESDKATMDIPAPAAGTVGEVAVRVGDRVCEGDLIMRLEDEPAPAPRLPRRGSGSPETRPRYRLSRPLRLAKRRCTRS